MNEEKQRIAIARACGWKDIRRPCDDGYHELPTDTLGFLMGRVGGIAPGCIHIENARPLPDYLNDLNAMHEAEKVLTDEQFFDWSKDKHTDMSYNGHLFRIVDRATPGSRPCRYHSATAAQRAEAFLRTLNLWKDSAE